MNIVIDTNILISALLKNSLTRQIIVESGIIFLFPEFEMTEIENYKEEILRKSRLTREEFYLILFNLLKHMKIIRKERILYFKKKADNIMKKIDLNDSQFIATALAFGCPVWSDDKHFKRQRAVKVLTTKKMIKITGINKK